MFEERKIQVLRDKLEILKSDNMVLLKRNAELEQNMKNMQSVIDAADEYREQHQKAMIVLSAAKEKYEIAYKEMLKTKKDYEKRMENVLKQFE